MSDRRNIAHWRRFKEDVEVRRVSIYDYVLLPGTRAGVNVIFGVTRNLYSTPPPIAGTVLIHA